MNQDLDKVRDIISAKLAADFHVLRIIDVRVRRDFDQDDEEVLLVDVIFEGEPRQVDAGALSGAARMVRLALLENNEDAFPVFSFIARHEMDALTRDSR